MVQRAVKAGLAHGVNGVELGWLVNTQRAEAQRDRRERVRKSESLSNTAAMQVDLAATQPTNEFKMPYSVPTSPTNGVTEAMVARLFRPRFISQRTTAAARLVLRLTASMISASDIKGIAAPFCSYPFL
jgi:hypothetical protein